VTNQPSTQRDGQPTPLAQKRYLKPADVAAIVELSEKTVLRAIAAGDLEASRLTRKRGGWRITHTAIDRWMKKRSTSRPRRRRRAIEAQATRAAGRRGTLEP